MDQSTARLSLFAKFGCDMDLVIFPGLGLDSFVPHRDTDMLPPPMLMEEIIRNIR